MCFKLQLLVVRDCCWLCELNVRLKGYVKHLGCLMDIKNNKHFSLQDLF